MFPGMRINKAISLLCIFNLCISFSFSPSLFADKTGLSDEELLDTIQRKSLDYFINERNLSTGLVRDNAPNSDQGVSNSPASIAATGFALAVYPAAASRDWLDNGTAREMVLATLRFFWERAPQEHGFFYHFMNPETGERTKNSELSPIDTALFLAGAMFAAEYFEDAEIRELVNKIYDRIDWPWMLHEGKTLAMAWSPETGFQRNRWDTYNESMVMYLQAMGSATHPIPADSWKAINRPVGSYREYRLIYQPPLFTHQYSHIFVDFKNKHDGFADYFKNSTNATLANRAFCINHENEFKSYGPESWGLTASDGPGGYAAYGAPPGSARHDGTVAPTACGSSIVFTPKESIACLRNFYENMPELWGRYGFADAFNKDKKWVSRLVLGIDQGPLFLMIENYRSGLIWKKMSQNISITKALQAAGFKEGTMEVAWPEPPVAEAVFLPNAIRVDALLGDWPNGKPLNLNESFIETGSFKEGHSPRVQIRFGWNQAALLFYAKVGDPDLVSRKTGKNIWMDDIMELYVDPQGDGLDWGSVNDFQIGFRPDKGADTVSTWSWFGDRGDPQKESVIITKSFSDSAGYIIEGAVSWEYLGIKPVAGSEVRISVAVHDVDSNRSDGKIQWFFRNEEKSKHYVLGKVVLKP